MAQSLDDREERNDQGASCSSVSPAQEIIDIKNLLRELNLKTDVGRVLPPWGVLRSLRNKAWGSLRWDQTMALWVAAPSLCLTPTQVASEVKLSRKYN